MKELFWAAHKGTQPRLLWGLLKNLKESFDPSQLVSNSVGETETQCLGWCLTIMDFCPLFGHFFMGLDGQPWSWMKHIHYVSFLGMSQVVTLVLSCTESFPGSC